MGAWSVSPWRDDGAADWFDDFPEKTQLAARVGEPLALDPIHHHEEVRASAAVLILLGRTFTWPTDDLDRHLDLAIERLNCFAQLEIYADAPASVATVGHEIALLRANSDGT